VVSIATANLYTVLRLDSTYSTHGREYYWVQRVSDGWCPSGPKQLNVDFRALPEVEVRAEPVDMGGDVTEEEPSTEEDEDDEAPPARKATKPKAKPKAKPTKAKPTAKPRPVRKPRVSLQLPHQTGYDPEADPDAGELVARLQRALVQRAAATKRAPLKDSGVTQAEQYAGWIVGVLAARAPDAPFNSLRTLHAWVLTKRHIRAALAAAVGVEPHNPLAGKWLDNHVSALNALSCAFFAFAEDAPVAAAEAEAGDEQEEQEQPETEEEEETEAEEAAGGAPVWGPPRGPHEPHFGPPPGPGILKTSAVAPAPEGSPTKKKKKKNKKNKKKRKRESEDAAPPETPPKKKKKKKHATAAAAAPMGGF